MPVTYLFNHTPHDTVEGMVRPSQILRRCRYDPARWMLLVQYGPERFSLHEDDRPFDLTSDVVLSMYPVARCDS